MSVNAYALTTRQRVMDFMGVSSLTTTQENVLDRMINSVTDFIEKYCGRRFKLTSYNEEHDAQGQETIVLNQYPVSVLTSFQYRNTTENSADWSSFDTDDYFVDYDSGTVSLTGHGRLLNYERRIYRVNYSAGYDYDNVTTFLSDEGAGDLEYVAWKLVTTVFDKRKGESGVESESIGDYSVTYSKTVFESADVKEVLDKYRRDSGFIAGTSSPYKF